MGRICELSGKLLSCEGKPQQSANLSRIYDISKLFSGVEKDAGQQRGVGRKHRLFD